MREGWKWGGCLGFAPIAPPSPFAWNGIYIVIKKPVMNLIGYC